MRGLLVVNPQATATTARTRDVLAGALGDTLKVDVAETTHRGHARELAGEARRDGFEVVVALGGDGTVNEVVNGLYDADDLADPGEVDPLARPALAVVPGGSTNVFVGALGLSRSPVEATGQILEALRSGRRRTIGLGAVNERLFTFCVGLGLDAEVVELVERRRAAGSPSTPGLYVRSAVQHFFTAADRRHPRLTLHRPGQDPIGHLFLGIVSNTTPWTFLANRPVHACPSAAFEAGLDLFAKRRLGAIGTLRSVRQMLAPLPLPVGRDLLLLHDLARFSLVGEVPVALQVDGDFLGRVDRADFASLPAALSVVM